MNEATLELDVIAVDRQAEGIVALTLARPDRSALPAWTPGAHIDLVLANGLIRQYSLCGGFENLDSWRIAVLLEPDGRGGSRYIHEIVGAGHRLLVRGPRNNFELVRRRRYLFIAGGIGITPILPMASFAAREGITWRLVYGGRSRSSMAFLNELSGYGESVSLVPADVHGVLDVERIIRGLEDETAVYCCGPEGLLQAVEAAVSGRRPGCELHVERFKASSLAQPGDKNAPFQVSLRRSGRIVDVPAELSLLEALVRAGVDLPSSCLEGICGTCEVRIANGRPLHRDQVLSEQEKAAGRSMMACVSRSIDPSLELDL